MNLSDQPVVARLESVASQDLQTVWPTVLTGLRKIERRNGSHWIAEDIYAALRGGHSTLRLAKVNDYYAGFVVLTPFQGFDGMQLQVWCAYAVGGYDPLELFSNEIDVIAHQIGAKRVTFLSTRAWARDGRIFKYGYRINQTEFVKEL